MDKDSIIDSLAEMSASMSPKTQNKPISEEVMKKKIFWHKAQMTLDIIVIILLVAVSIYVYSNWQLIRLSQDPLVYTTSKLSQANNHEMICSCSFPNSQLINANSTSRWISDPITTTDDKPREVKTTNLTDSLSKILS